MKFLFLFLDGVGLGADDPAINPLAAAQMPNLRALLGGRRLLAQDAPTETRQAALLSLDAGLGVPGRPQSASGQAALLTGRNVPAEIGGHYGPKPNPRIADILGNGNLFKSLRQRGLRAALLGAYPQTYFQAIHSGRRLYSAIPLAAVKAGLRLMTEQDYYAGRALPADFTGQGWREHLGYPDAPLLSPRQAGKRLAALARQLDFAFFEFWLSDFAGHRQDMAAALDMLHTLDRVLGALVDEWPHQEGLIFLTSDHGNLEDLSTRRHTRNPVPALVIGHPALRAPFVVGLRDLTGVTPAVLRMYEKG